MDERAKLPDAPEVGDASAPDADRPSIPDGGLGVTMPDWLQRPPAWRGMAVREPERRDLQPPDTSVIDPRTMLDLGDLPVWLQRIAARSVESETAEMYDLQVGTAPSTEPASEPDPEPPDTASPDAAGTAPVQPPAQGQEGRSPKIAFRPASPDQQTAWWRSRMALAGLVVFLVFLIVWVVLVAT